MLTQSKDDGRKRAKKSHRKAIWVRFSLPYDSKKHSGIISEFRKRYVKTGVFREALSDIIGELFTVRSGGDYDDFYVVSREKAWAQYQNAAVFVSEIESYFKTI